MLPKCLILVLIASLIEADYPYSIPCTYPKLEHGRVRFKQRARLVKFVCSLRYELVGDRYATCRGGRWDAPMPVCVRSGCEPLPVSPNSLQVKEHQDAWVVTFCHPGHKLVGSSAVYCDGFKWNDTAPTCVDSSVSSTLSCDFEEPTICGWVQDELHDFDWLRWNKKTPSAFVRTGPSYDHTYGQQRVGYYMYIESTSRNVNATARLLSPIYNSSLTVNGCFSFFYHMLGKDMGGLKVYQKPSSLQLNEMLNLVGADQKYLLFTQWGNLGDFWYNAVPQLIPMTEDFQIVIEGIRGLTFISDIAIDDVSILQGEECSSARLAAATPPPTDEVQTCAERCEQETTDPHLCGCTIDCVISGTCCPDFLDACYNVEDGDSITETLPETQKLVGETTTPKATTVTSEPTKTSLRTTPAVKTTTTIKTTPAVKPTPAVKTTTTIKTTPAVKPTPAVKTTTAVKTTPAVKTTTAVKTTPKPTTIKATTRKVTTAMVTTPKVLPTQKVTYAPAKQNMTDDEIEKKSEAEVNLNKMGTSKTQTKSKSSTWKTAVITIVLLALCISLIYVAVTARTARGRQAIARLRGRTNHDSEVRYLNSTNDDDL